MSSDYLVQAIIPHDSALPEDVAINTWSCFTTATGDEGALQEFVDELKAFYLSVDAYISKLMDGPIVFKAYDRADPQPRVPVLTDSLNPIYATTALPMEVALCMSFQALPESGVNQARRRGRIYLGPLGTNGADADTGRPTSAFITALAAAGDTLVTVSKAAADWSWAVWSETNGSSSTVNNGWVDNEWDTMRSRGRRATSRTTFS